MYTEKSVPIEFRTCYACEDQASRLHVTDVSQFFDSKQAKVHLGELKRFRRKRHLPTIKE